MPPSVALPPPRPVLWPLRPVGSARIDMRVLPDGRRRIVIEHAPLRGVTPAMLAWWFGHVEGNMEYAGRRMARYLVWHPLDHISYQVIKRVGDVVGPGATLHIREAFQRDPRNLLDVTVTVERIDEQSAVIGHRVLGLSALRLVNTFEPIPVGVRYTTELTIGSATWPGRHGLNRLLRGRIMPGEQARKWARHHVEEVGYLEHFLPALYDAQVTPEHAEAR